MRMFFIEQKPDGYSKKMFQGYYMIIEYTWRREYLKDGYVTGNALKVKISGN